MARHSKTAAADNTIPLGILTPEEVKRAASQIDGKVTESWGFGRLKWTPMQWTVFKCKEDEIGMLGGKGSGKAQPLDSLVFTRYGPKRMGDMQVGDSVCNPDGTNARVLAIWPRGEGAHLGRGAGG
jgi:hypothetical protein